MISAVVPLGKTTPFSYNSTNSKNGGKYQQRILDAFAKNYNGKIPKFRKGKELYGQVFFFTSEGSDLDADNISKPVWDALIGTVYDDDKQIVEAIEIYLEDVIYHHAFKEWLQFCRNLFNHLWAKNFDVLINFDVCKKFGEVVMHQPVRYASTDGIGTIDIVSVFLESLEIQRKPVE